MIILFSVSTFVSDSAPAKHTIRKNARLEQNQRVTGFFLIDDGVWAVRKRRKCENFEEIRWEINFEHWQLSAILTARLANTGTLLDLNLRECHPRYLSLQMLAGNDRLSNFFSGYLRCISSGLTRFWIGSLVFWRICWQENSRIKILLQFG